MTYAKRTIERLVSILVLSLPASAAMAASHVLPVPMKPQQSNSWCWAASGQMIFDYVGGTVNLRQCDEANHEFLRTDCCGTQACTSDASCPAGQVCGDTCMPASCNQGGHTEFTPWDFTAQNTSCAFLSFAQLKAEIDANRPVEFAWSEGCANPTSSSCFALCGNSLTGGHVLVAVGYNDDPKLGQFVYVNDPWPPKKGAQYWLSYSDWISEPQGDLDATFRASVGSVYYTQSQNYNIKDDGFCYSDNFGLASSNFQHCFDYNGLRGRNPVAISFMTSATGDTVASSFQSVPPRPVRDFLTLDQFDADVISLRSSGYRPDSVSVMVKAGTPQVTGIWVPAEAAFQSSCRLTPGTLTSTDNSNRAQGYVMTDLFGYAFAPPGSSAISTYFCATWVKKAGTYSISIDQTAAQYNTSFGQKSSTMIPLRFSAYDAAAGHLYAILWQSQPQGGWTQFFDMTPTFYQTEFTSIEGQGLHQSAISSLDGHYSVLWATPGSGR
jgi:hypothetical protein